MSRSMWTHSICRSCYAKENPDREPFRIIDAEEEICCFCGNKTSEGIFYRKSPATLRCKGLHNAKSITT